MSCCCRCKCEPEIKTVVPKASGSSPALVGSVKTAKQINEMIPGELGYTMHWAAATDADGCLWLRGDYTVHPSESGTRSLYVRRTLTGFIVTPKERYPLGDKNGLYDRAVERVNTHMIPGVAEW